MSYIPNEIVAIIYTYYISIYMLKYKKLHDELLSDSPVLHLTEEIYDFELDFYYAIRLPRLVDN